MMKLECEYIELLQDGATFSEDILSQYPEDILQGAVSMERELLVLDHPELIEMITGENHSSMPDSLRSLASVTDTMKHARSYSLWEQRETYPNFVEDLNIDYKINRLENLVNSRKGYLALEDEYLRLLRERHTKNHVHQIHLEYIWEHILKLTLSWKKNLRLMEDALAPDRREKHPLEFEYAEGIKKMIKEAEQEYYELIQKQHLTILNGISTMDATQVYAKYIHKELLARIAYMRRKIKPLEREHNHILRKVMYDRIDKQAIVSRGITLELWKAVRQYFDRLIYNIQTRNFLQPPVKMEADSESLNNSVEEEEEFMTTLYYSVKSLSIYCVECMSCINNLIQQALGLEDDDDYKLSPKISYEGEKCNEVVDKFLYLRSIYCPNCIRVVRRVTLQHVPWQTSTTSIPNQGGEAICNEEGSVITMPPNETKTIIRQSSRVGRRWKIGSCIVVGGLMESITSLVIVTAATTANMSNGSIYVSFDIPNLITRFFIVRHDDN